MSSTAYPQEVHTRRPTSGIEARALERNYRRVRPPPGVVSPSSIQRGDSRFSHVAVRRLGKSEIGSRTKTDAPSYLQATASANSQQTFACSNNLRSVSTDRITAHREIIPAVARDGLAGAWLATALDHANEAYVPVPVYTSSHVLVRLLARETIPVARGNLAGFACGEVHNSVRGSSHALQLSANWGSGDCIIGIHCSQVKIVAQGPLYQGVFWAETTDAGGWLLAWSLYGVLNFDPHSTTNQTRAMARIRAAPNIITTASRTDTGEIRTSDESHQGRMREAGDQHAASSKFQPRKLLASRRGNRGAGTGTGTSAPSWRFPVCLLKSSTHFSPPRPHHAPRVACAADRRNIAKNGTVEGVRGSEVGYPLEVDISGWRLNQPDILQELTRNPLWQKSHSRVFLQITPADHGRIVVETEQRFACTFCQVQTGRRQGHINAGPGYSEATVLAQPEGRRLDSDERGIKQPQATAIRPTDGNIRYYCAHSSSLAAKESLKKTVRRQHEEKKDGESEVWPSPNRTGTLQYLHWIVVNGPKRRRSATPNRTGNLQEVMAVHDDQTQENVGFGSTRESSSGSASTHEIRRVTKTNWNSNRSLGHLGRGPALPNSCGRLASSESGVRRAHMIYGWWTHPPTRAHAARHARNSVVKKTEPIGGGRPALVGPTDGRRPGRRGIPRGLDVHRRGCRESRNSLLAEFHLIITTVPTVQFNRHTWDPGEDGPVGSTCNVKKIKSTSRSTGGMDTHSDIQARIHSMLRAGLFGPRAMYDERD
ncbi:hypothetical protein C8R46DRAFT_1031594 [Mycena filopes]|nr:hypothetical protein C8R46DRAFT_1031594 [Mycena filopes]